MLGVVKCMLALLVYILIFDIWGTTLSRVLKWEISQVEKALCGFFVYYLVFQLVYLPFALLKASFTALAYVWTICMVIITVLCIIYLFRKKAAVIHFEKTYLNVWKYGYVYVICLLSGLGIIYCVLQHYVGWDTSYYIGLMNEALYSNTIGLYNGDLGVLEKTLPIRYVLSGFYMQFAVCSKLLQVKPVIVSFYMVRALCVILSEVIVFSIGKLLFDKKTKPACLMALVWLCINMMWYTEHATPLFLIRRSYEAKGYCSNVVLPMVFYCLLRLYQEKGKRKNDWQILFLCCAASVSISMSCLVTVPVMVLIGVFVLSVFEKNMKYIVYGLLCLLPNIIYGALYLLNVLDLWVIEV